MREPCQTKVYLFFFDSGGKTILCILLGSHPHDFVDFHCPRKKLRPKKGTSFIFLEGKKSVLVAAETLSKSAGLLP